MIAKMKDLGAETAKKYWVDSWAQAIENAQTPQWAMTAEQMNLLDTLTN